MKVEAWKAALLIACVLFHAVLFAAMKMPEYSPRVPNVTLLFNLIDDGEKYVPPPEPPELPEKEILSAVERSGGAPSGENESSDAAEPTTGANPETEPVSVPESDAGIEPDVTSHEQTAETGINDAVKDEGTSDSESSAGSGSQSDVGSSGNGDGSGTGTGSTPSNPPEVKPESQVDVKAVQNEYVVAVKSKIYGCKFYPEQAQRMEHEGSVKVRFTVSGGGSVSGVSVASSSGFDDLDSAAVQAVKNAAPFAAIPEELGKSSLTISVTLKYYLK